MENLPRYLEWNIATNMSWLQYRSNMFKKPETQKNLSTKLKSNAY